jgi:hypothetical protein
MAWDSDTRWKALDLFVKATAGALIAAAVALFGYWMQEQQRNAAEDNAQLRALVEFSSTQKNLDVNVGMQLLSKFVDYYLKPPAETFEANRQTLLMLRLLSLNFQDVPINLKPLFEDLDKRLRDSGQASAPELRDQLVSIAKEVANRQAYRFSYVSGILAKPVRVQPGAEINFTEQGLPLMLKVLSIADGHVSVVLTELGSATPREFGPFTVSYFDLPIVDNIKLDKTNRVALLLLGVDKDNSSAELRLVSFLPDLAIDRFDIKEMTRDFSSRRFGN